MNCRRCVADNLASVQLFEGLSAAQLRGLSQLSTLVELPAGATLAREGSTGREFFMVVAGEVEVIRGHELVATRGPGSHLGEIALLERCPRTATLVAKTHVSVAVANSGEFAAMLRLVPTLAERLYASTTQHLIHLH